MARVHRLQEIEGFRTADLADDNPLRAHAQAIPHEIAHGDRASSFKVWRARFEAHNMRLPQLQLGSVLAGYHALVMIDVIGHTVEKGRFSRARPARNQDIATHPSNDYCPRYRC